MQKFVRPVPVVNTAGKLIGYVEGNSREAIRRQAEAARTEIHMVGVLNTLRVMIGGSDRQARVRFA